MAFFRTPEQLDFSGLSAQASTQVGAPALLVWLAPALVGCLPDGRRGRRLQNRLPNTCPCRAWLRPAQLERARRLAAQYAAAALQSRPKLRLHLELDAP